MMLKNLEGKFDLEEGYNLDRNSPHASVFALRATPRHVARVAEIAEEIFY